MLCGLSTLVCGGWNWCFVVLLVLGLLALPGGFLAGFDCCFLAGCLWWLVCLWFVIWFWVFCGCGVVCDLVLGLRLLGVGLGGARRVGFWISLVGVLVSNWFGVLCWFSGFCFRVV